MDIPDSKEHESFWEAYRACAEENRIRPDRSPLYVSWARDFANFLPEKSCSPVIPPPPSHHGQMLSRKNRVVKEVQGIQISDCRLRTSQIGQGRGVEFHHRVATKRDLSHHQTLRMQR